MTLRRHLNRNYQGPPRSSGHADAARAGTFSRFQPSGFQQLPFRARLCHRHLFAVLRTDRFTGWFGRAEVWPLTLFGG